VDELTDDAKKMLDSLKTDETPSKASSDRMWAAVAAGGATAALAAGIGNGKLILFAALGITAIGAIVVLSQPDEDASAVGRGMGSAAPQVTATAGDPKPEPEPLEEPEEPEVEPQPEVEPPPEVEVDPAQPETKKTGATAAPPTAGDLERELEMIGEAKTALRQKDAKEALRILTDHKKDFPRSSFGEERAFLKMTALCDLGQAEKARKEAERFLKKHPKSALTPRVKTLCTEP